MYQAGFRKGDSASVSQKSSVSMTHCRCSCSKRCSGESEAGSRLASSLANVRSSATLASSAARLQSGILPSYSWRPACTAKYGSVLKRASMNESTKAGHSVRVCAAGGGGAAVAAGFSAVSREQLASTAATSRLDARSVGIRILDLLKDLLRRIVVEVPVRRRELEAS